MIYQKELDLILMIQIKDTLKVKGNLIIKIKHFKTLELKRDIVKVLEK